MQPCKPSVRVAWLAGARGQSHSAIVRERCTWLAAAVFVSMAIATTGIVRATGRQVVDTERYQAYAESMRSELVPYRDFDVEYPPGALAIFALPALVVSGESGYFWVFAALMAITGGVGVFLTAAALGRLDRPPRVRHCVLALLAVSPAAFGGVLLTRFDLVPATLVAGAMLLLLSDRPRTASLTLGTAAVVKLYPLALLPLLAVWTWKRLGRRKAVLCSALAVGVVAFAYLPFVLLSPEGVAQSVWRQLSRPLQIESLGAGVLLLLHHAAGLDVVVETNYGSQNLTGTTAASFAYATSAVSIAAIVWLWIRFARGEPSPERVVRYGAATLVALVAFAKVLSPQFLVWLLFPLALVAGRRGAAAGAYFTVAAIATAVWFPWLYFELPRDGDPFVVALVVLRGLVLVAALAVLAWPQSATAPPSSPRLRVGGGE